MQFLDFRKRQTYKSESWVEYEQNGHSISSVTRELQIVVDQILAAAHKPSTSKTYDHHWEYFKQFVENILSMPFEPPIETHVVIMFLAYLFDQCKKYCTLLNYLVAINYQFKIRSLPYCNNSFVIKTFLEGAKNLSPQSAALLSITIPMLQRLIFSVEKIITSNYDKKLLKAMFATMYFSCLRIGEVAFSGHGDHIIQIGQVTINKVELDIISYIIQILTFKQSGSRTPAITILRREGGLVCPVHLLIDYLRVRSAGEGPLFLLASNRHVDRYHFQKMLKLCLTYLGWDKHHINTHHFRIGRATDMFSQNCPDTYVQEVGRWASDAFKRYIRPHHIYA